MSGGPPDEIEPILVQIEENRITEHVSIMIACDKLLGFVNFKSLEVVYAEIGEQPECIRTFDIEIRHMKRLLEENAGLPPGTLFIPPVRVLGGSRKGVGTYLRVTQHFDRAFGSLQRVFQALVTHSCSQPPSTQKSIYPDVAESTMDSKLTQGDVLGDTPCNARQHTRNERG